jgi:hypothetical protein
MSTNLSRYFQAVRERTGIPLGRLAASLGYANISKGATRIRTFENTGQIPPHLLHPLAVALGIPTEIVRDLKSQDRREWLAQMEVPVNPHLIVRLMPAILASRSLPEGISKERAKRTASVIARRKQAQVVLVWDQRHTIQFDERGVEVAQNIAEPPTPYSRWNRNTQ